MQQEGRETVILHYILNLVTFKQSQKRKSKHKINKPFASATHLNNNRKYIATKMYHAVNFIKLQIKI